MQLQLFRGPKKKRKEKKFFDKEMKIKVHGPRSIQLKIFLSVLVLVISNNFTSVRILIKVVQLTMLVQEIKMSCKRINVMRINQ